MKIRNIGAAALFSFAALACIPAFAQPAGVGAAGSQGAQKPTPGQDQPSFETIKADAIKYQQARMQAMQQSLTCVQAATDREALHTCREKEHEAMRQLHEQTRASHPGGRGGPQGGSGQGKGPGAGGGSPRQ